MELFNMRVGPELKDIHNITPCDPTLCLDLKVPNVDILPMLRTGNALKMEAFIDPKNAPKTFQLKGFIEFEVKADLPF